MIFLAKNLTYLLEIFKGNVKQIDLARKTGLTTSTLSSYKSDTNSKRKRTYPNPETLRILCLEFGIDANTMLYIDIEAAGSIELAIEQGLALFGLDFSSQNSSGVSLERRPMVITNKSDDSDLLRQRVEMLEKSIKDKELIIELLRNK